MKSLKLFLWAGILFFCITAWADVPRLINFQGRLSKDTLGTPVKDSTYSILFTIYDAFTGGTDLWSETQSVATKGGTFNVSLGSATALPDTIFDDTTRYLAMKVGSDPEMTPRQRMVSMAYGYRVRTVDGATGGVISGDVDIQSDLTVSGNVGIGTTSPDAPLTVYDDNTLGERGLRIDKVLGVTTANSYALTAVNTTSPAAGFANFGGFFSAFANVGPSGGDKYAVRGAAQGTGNRNIAGYFFADGATDNYGLYVDGGLGYFSSNVGIGTASPLSQLHLESSNPISQGIRIYNTSASGDPNIHFLTDGVFQYTLGVDNDDNDKLQISAGSTLNSSELLTLTSAGNVGIGTTSPANRLSVTGSADFSGNVGIGIVNPPTKLYVKDVGQTHITIEAPGTGTNNPILEFISGSNLVHLALSASSSGTGQAGDLYYWDGSTYRFVIKKTTGNVGIGTTSPQSTLQVNGYIQLAMTSGAPPAADCDAASERGRMKFDNASGTLYICGDSGWVTK